MHFTLPKCCDVHVWCCPLAIQIASVDVKWAFSSGDLEFWPMTLTFKGDLSACLMCRSDVISCNSYRCRHTHTHTHTSDRLIVDSSTRTIRAVGKDSRVLCVGLMTPGYNTMTVLVSLLSGDNVCCLTSEWSYLSRCALVTIIPCLLSTCDVRCRRELC